MDDVETLRLRAKAKAKAARERVQTAPEDVPVQPKQETFGETFEHPYSSLAAKIPESVPPWLRTTAKVAAGALDIPMQLPSMIARGSGEVSRGLNAPDFATGAAQVAHGIAQAGLGAALLASPAPFLKFAVPVTAASQIPGVGEAIQTATNPVTSIAQPETEFGKAVSGLGDIVAQAAAFRYVPKLVGGTIETGASRLAGKAFGAGENFMRTRELGKFAQEHGYTLSERGYDKAKGLAQHLNDEINQKIIDPATQAGETINAPQYVQRLQEFRQTLLDRSVPDRASVMAIDRMIQSATERANRFPNGQIPVDEAQKMKVENNQILHEVYKNLAQGGNITERGAAKKAGLVQLTDDLRTQLEQVHPELQKVNWHEGAALELKNAMYDYLNRTARGEGGTNIVARGGIGKVATVSIYDLLKLRPISSRVAVLMGKVGRGLSGNEPDIVTGVKNPFIAPPVTAPPLQTNPPTVTPPQGTPPTPPSGGTPTQPLAPSFTRTQGISNRIRAQAVQDNPGLQDVAQNAGVRIEEIKGGRVRYTDVTNTWHTSSLPVDQFTPENIKADIATKGNPNPPQIPKEIPDVALRARKHIESGGVYTTAQANLVRQAWPQEAEDILAKGEPSRASRRRNR